MKTLTHLVLEHFIGHLTSFDQIEGILPKRRRTGGRSFPITDYIDQTIHGTGIFTYIYHTNQPNVGKYTRHGWSGDDIDDFGHVGGDDDTEDEDHGMQSKRVQEYKRSVNHIGDVMSLYYIGPIYRHLRICTNNSQHRCCVSALPSGFYVTFQRRFVRSWRKIRSCQEIQNYRNRR